jgi:hypothetical protein
MLITKLPHTFSLPFSSGAEWWLGSNPSFSGSVEECSTTVQKNLAQSGLKPIQFYKTF